MKVCVLLIFLGKDIALQHIDTTDKRKEMKNEGIQEQYPI
jgi:hypothetical protein